MLKKILFTGFIFECLISFSQSPGWFNNYSSQVDLNIGATFTLGFADVNNDDYPDVIALSTALGNIYNTRAPLKIFLNIDDTSSSNPFDRKFIDITPQSLVNVVPPDTGQNANIYTLADFNNDGNVDLVTGIFYDKYTTTNYPMKDDRFRVYLGDGTGVFNYLPNSGLELLGLKNGRMFTALDYDLDGNLDLYLSTFMKNYYANTWDHGYLLKGNGDGTFTDVTTSAGDLTKLEPIYGSAAYDYNNDCYPDLIVAPYCRTGGSVYKNNGDGTFTDVSTDVGYNLYLYGDGTTRACTFSVIPEDVDNDGDMDVFVSVVHGGNDPGEYRSTIIKNNGPLSNYSFDLQYNVLPVSPPASSHRGDYDGAFLDFDNDGLKDLVMAQATYQPTTDRSYFWKQQPDHSFVDVTNALGLVIPDLKSSGSVEVFDYDLDGDDDVVFCVGGAMKLYKNEIGQNKSWVSVKLNAGLGINKNAIGARVYVYVNDTMYMREQIVGRGLHTGQQPLILNFGLNNAVSIDSIVVRWPGANCKTTTVTNPPINSMVTISSDIFSNIETPSFNKIKIYPNPATNYLIIQQDLLQDYYKSISLFDIAGKEVKTSIANSDNNKCIINMEFLPKGIYVLKLEDKNGQVYCHKVIK